MFNRQPFRSPSFPPPPTRGLRISDARLTIVTSRVSSGLPATSRLKRRALIKKALCMCVCVCLVFENRRNQEKGIEKGINKRMEGISGKRFSVVKRSREKESRKGNERKEWSNGPLSQQVPRGSDEPLRVENV